MLGTRIAILRKCAGMTQTELASHIHVSPSTIGMYEQGRRLPTISILTALSQEFNVTIDYLISGTPSSVMDAHAIASIITREAKLDRQIIRAAAPSANDRIIVEVVRLLAK